MPEKDSELEQTNGERARRDALESRLRRPIFRALVQDFSPIW